MNSDKLTFYVHESNAVIERRTLYSLINNGRSRECPNILPEKLLYATAIAYLFRGKAFFSHPSLSTMQQSVKLQILEIDDSPYT